MDEQAQQNQVKTKIIDKEKIKNWLKNPLNLILVLVLIFAFAIRFYYFIQTKSQPLWWDEASYGSLAKNYISHAWDNTSIIKGETLIRPPLFPLLWSILLRLNIPETGFRFILEFIPSILTVFSVYLVGKEIHNKKTGIISAFIFSVLWIHLFYTTRLLTDIPTLPFLFFSIYFFIKSTKMQFNPKYFAFSLILLSLSTLIRYPNGLVFFVYILSLFFTNKFNLITKKKFWISGIIGIFPMLFFFLFNLITKGNIFPAFLSGKAAEKANPDIAFNILNFIPQYLTQIFFIFFMVGMIIAVFELVLGFDLIMKKTKLKGHLILFFVLIATFSYFIFYIRAAEDRWLFSASLSLVYFTGFGLNQSYEFVRKHNKIISIVLLLGILVFGAQAQLKIANSLIEDKKNSFLQIRQGFEWIKENTREDSIILGQGIQVYALYYAERQYKEPPSDAKEMSSIKADYLVVHVFSGQPSYIHDYLNANQDKWQPVQAYSLDKTQQQPALVIYKATSI